MTGVPSSMAVEINFGGSWTDVSTYSAGSVANIHYGRQSEFSDATAATLSGIILDNSDGRFTPLCDLLLDGVTANPYYPNVLPRAQIRLSYTISAVKYYFYWGFIQSWPPSRQNGDGKPVVTITANCGLSILNGIDLRAAPTEVATVDGAIAFWSFNDAAGPVCGDAISNLTAISSGVVSSTPTSCPDGQSGMVGGWQTSTIPTVSAMNTTWSLEGWMTFSPDNIGNYADASLTLSSVTTTFFGFVALTSAVAGSLPQVLLQYSDAAGFVQTSLGAWFVPNDQPHYYRFTGHDNGTNLTINMCIDQNPTPVLTLTTTSGHGQFGTDGPAKIFGSNTTEFVGAAPPVTFADIGLYPTVLTTTQTALHYAAGSGGIGQSTGQRITEMLRWKGFTSTAIATGIQNVANHAVAGKTLLAACQDMSHTEGGGSVFYNDPANGQFTFFDRHERSTITPLFTVDVEADLDGPQFQPSFDSLTLVNQSTLQRPNGAAQTVSDQTSINQYGISTDQGGSVYPDSDAAVLYLAQERVATQKTPAYRVGKLAIDLMTATTAGLYLLYGVIKVGSRIRVSNLVAAQTAPLTTADVYVEGWTLTAAPDQFMAVLDTTPADNPARAKVGTAKAAPIFGDSKLNASVTSSATALAIKWTTGPKWTATSGAYPVVIQIDQEQIKLNGVPGGSTSPQSWTGVTRGFNGTRQAPHSANAVVTLAPRYAVQL